MGKNDTNAWRNAGKGDKVPPRAISDDEWDTNWERTFGKKEKRDDSVDKSNNKLNR